MSEGRRSGLRRRLEFTLVGVALVSVLLLSGLNYVFARVLVAESVEAQLSALRDTRVQAIERGASRVQTEISMLAVTPSVITALDELRTGFDDTDDELSGPQLSELEAAYDEALEPLAAVGQVVPSGSLLPSSDTGRFIQYHYILGNPDEFDDRDRLDDAGDGSAYSAAHAKHHPFLRSLMDSVGVSDLLLVDARTGDVVYSVQKRIDLGTNAVTGPWGDNGLGDVVDALSQVTVGDGVISDTVFYVPARGQAVVLVAAAVRSGSDIVGALVAELPVSVITDLVTADEDWDLLGLEDTGDIYLVGADGTLRTDPRAWLADPDGFLDDFLDRTGDREGADRMRLVGSPALTQQVDNNAIDAAQAGEVFAGTVTSFDGARTLATSAPVDLGGQEWIVVVEQDRFEANAGLATLLRGTLIVIAVLLPTTALIGWWMARSLTHPFGVLVSAAGRIARGEPPSGIESLGNNELGDVGRQLAVVSARLEAEEAAVSAEEEQINDVLGAVIPPRLIDRVRRGEQGIADMLDTATAISLLVDGTPEATGSDQDTVYEIAEQLTVEVDRLLEEHGVERVRRSLTNSLFVSGLDHDDARIEDALRFTAEVIELVALTGAEYGQALTVRAGLAAGNVASGVIGQQQLTFSMWGEPVSTAFTLASLAQPGEVLVDPSIRDAVASSWQLDERGQLQGLDDDVEAWSVRLPEPTDT